VPSWRYRGLRQRADGADQPPRRLARLRQRRLASSLAPRPRGTSRTRWRSRRPRGWRTTTTLPAGGRAPVASAPPTTTSWSTRRWRSARTRCRVGAGGDPPPVRDLGARQPSTRTGWSRDTRASSTTAVDVRRFPPLRPSTSSCCTCCPGGAAGWSTGTPARCRWAAGAFGGPGSTSRSSRWSARVLPRLERQADPPGAARPLRLHARELHAQPLGRRGADHLLHGPDPPARG
jgi:hypothetical protein